MGCCATQPARTVGFADEQQRQDKGRLGINTGLSDPDVVVPDQEVEIQPSQFPTLATLHSGAPIGGTFYVTSIRAKLPDVLIGGGGDSKVQDQPHYSDDDLDARDKPSAAQRARARALRRRDNGGEGQPGAALDQELPFCTARVEPRQPLSSRVEPKRPQGPCCHALTPSPQRGRDWWTSVPEHAASGRAAGRGAGGASASARGAGVNASGGAAGGAPTSALEAGEEATARSAPVDDENTGATIDVPGTLRLEQEDLYIDAWSMSAGGLLWLGAGVVHVRPILESALQFGAGGISVPFPVTVDLFEDMGSRRAGTWWVEVQFKVTGAEHRAMTRRMANQRRVAQKQRRKHKQGLHVVEDVPVNGFVSGRVTVTAVTAAFLREKPRTRHYLATCVGPAEPLNLRPPSVGAARTEAKGGGGVATWSGGGSNVLGATVTVDVRNANVDKSWMYVRSCLLLAPLVPCVGVDMRCGLLPGCRCCGRCCGVVRTSFVEAFREDEYSTAAAGKLIGTGKLSLRKVVDAATRAGGIGHLMRLPVFLFAKASRSTVAGLLPAGSVYVDVRFESASLAPPRFVLTKLFGRLVVTSLHATLESRLGWEWGDAEMRPFLAASLEPRRRLGARRDPLVPKHVCTGDVMRYHDEAQRLFVCNGRQDVGATMYLHPRPEDNVHIDESALYFEAWTR